MSNRILANVDTNRGPVSLYINPKTGLGVIDKQAEIAFTRGYCHVLAYEINKETGWPIIGIGGYFGQCNSPSHFINYCPKIGDYIDINGPNALERNENFVLGRIYQFKPEQLLGLDCYEERNALQNSYLAKPFVATLLNDINKLPEKKGIIVPSWKPAPSKFAISRMNSEQDQFADFLQMLRGVRLRY